MTRRLNQVLWGQWRQRLERQRAVDCAASTGRNPSPPGGQFEEYARVSSTVDSGDYGQQSEPKRRVSSSTTRGGPFAGVGRLGSERRPTSRSRQAGTGVRAVRCRRAIADQLDGAIDVGARGVLPMNDPREKAESGVALGASPPVIPDMELLCGGSARAASARCGWPGIRPRAGCAPSRSFHSGAPLRSIRLAARSFR